jgi:hypothetical protein
LVFIGVSDFLANLLLGAATNFGLVHSSWSLAPSIP